MSSKNGQSRAFGKFRLDAKRRVLWFENEPVALPLKQIEILCILTENVGQVVTKDEIINRVWPDAFVDDSNLSRHIYLLRKIFKDCGEDRVLIKTVPQRGYRFIAEVTEIHEDAARNGIEEENPVESAGNDSVLKNRRTLAVAAIVLIFILVGVVAWQFSRVGVSGKAVQTETLAVVPFSPVEGEGTSEFNTRLTDVLIRSLSKIRTLEVLPLKSVRDLAARDVDPISVAASLGADLVITGDYLIGSESIRAHVTLQRRSDNATLLDETFSLDSRDNIDYETAVAFRASKLVSEKIRRTDETVFDKAKVSQEAIDNYLNGREIWRQQTLDRADEMQRHFRLSIELAPDWSLAYSALAEAMLNPDRGPIDFDNAETHARKALELDPLNSGANAALARIYYIDKRDWKTAETYLQKALEGDANYAPAYHEYAQLLALQRRFVQARQMEARAIEIDPFQPAYFNQLSAISYYERKTKDALINCEIALSLDPTFWSARKRLHTIYVLEKNYSRLAELHTKGPSNDETLKQIVLRGTAAGDLSEYWEYVIDKQLKARPDSPQYLALAYHFMQLNKPDEVLAALEKSEIDSEKFIQTINVDPAYDPVRADPRFIAVIEKLGLNNNERN